MPSSTAIRPFEPFWLKPFDPLKIFDDIFIKFEDAPKPPLALLPLKEKDVTVGLEIQVAVAGFKEEDLSVHFDKGVLYITGDNTGRADEIAEKFQCKFEKHLPVRAEVDVENASVSLEDGLLKIKLPLTKPQNTKTRLFGRPPD